ncbi:MAG TPA: DUF4091 domain-containing protein [bacterium]|mgnify:CR=1 FL=1|nr:DUF4091 domain-containing protein [bacterium]
MKLRIILSLLLFLVPATSFSLPLVEDYNGGFEKGKESPENWSTYASPGTKASFAVDRQIRRTGQASVFLKNEGPKTALWQTIIDVVGGAEYTVTVWAKLKNGRGKTGLVLQSLREKPVPSVKGPQQVSAVFSSIDEDIFLTGTTDGWQQLCYTARMPSEAVKAKILLSNQHGHGDEVWFDDLEISDNILETFQEMAPQFISFLEKNRFRAKEVSLSFSEIERTVKNLARELSRIKGQSSLATPERANLWKLLQQAVTTERKLSRHFFSEQLFKKSKDDVAVVWADSMSRVFIEEMPLSDKEIRKAELALFPGEIEAIQMVLIPRKNLQDLTVKILPIGSTEKKLPPETFSWKVVGYVRIENPSVNYYRSEPFPCSNWWPDPLLEKETFSVEKNTFQPIWLEVKVPRTVKPGIYYADVIITGKGLHHQERLNIEVLPGYLPEKWYLKKNLSFSPRMAKEYSGRLGYGERWPAVADRFYNLLIDYRIGIGSLYEGIDYYPPKVVQKAVRHGQNYFHAAGISVARVDPGGQPTLKKEDWVRLEEVEKKLVPWLREQGLLPLSCFYGFDEQWYEFFDFAAQIFSRVKKTGLKTMSTIHDASYGTNSVLKDALDIFVAGVTSYNYETALKARQMGKEVWWYNGPGFNIETDTVFPRLIPWRTLLVEADGFLLWNSNRWAGNSSFISDSIRSEWNAALDGLFLHSYPMLIYPGEQGPVSSLRLENFRDGIEDYDIFCETAEKIRRPEESSVEARRRLMTELGLDRKTCLLMAPEQIRTLRQKLAVYWK